MRRTPKLGVSTLLYFPIRRHSPQYLSGNPVRLPVNEILYRGSQREGVMGVFGVVINQPAGSFQVGPVVDDARQRVSTRARRRLLKFYSLGGENTPVKRMFDLGHFGDRVGHFDDRRRRIPAGHDQVQPGRFVGVHEFGDLFAGNPAVTAAIVDFVEQDQIELLRQDFFLAEFPDRAAGVAMSCCGFCVSQVNPSPMACHSMLSNFPAARCSPVFHLPLMY